MEFKKNMAIILSILSIINVANQKVTRNKLFTKSNFKCSCESDSIIKEVLIHEQKVSKNKIQLTISGLRTNNDTLILEKQKLDYYIIANQQDSLKAYPFILFSSNYNSYTYFRKGKLFGMASQKYNDTSCNDSKYLVSFGFEGVVVDSKIIYKVDFDKKSHIYQFSYFDGTHHFICN